MVLGAALVVFLAITVAVAIAWWRRRGRGRELDIGTAAPEQPLSAIAPRPGAAEVAPATDALAHALPPPRDPLGVLAPRRGAVVVFVHGFAGFGELRFGPARAAYFRGVGEHLARRGIRAAFAALPSVAPIATRGAALARYLDELGDVDVHLVGHSMGGLDARWVLQNAAPRRVRSLVTIATPHRGTPLADLGSAVLGRPDRATRLRGFVQSVADLTRAYLVEQGDAPIAGLACASVIVEPALGARGVRPLFRPTHRLIEALEGPNDGIVPVKSQAWGDVLGTVDSDHCGVLGWARDFDAPSFYGALAASLLEGAPSLAAWEPGRPRIARVERIPPALLE